MADPFGAGTQIIALLDVPRGTLSLGNNVQATGAFGGFSVVAGTNVTLIFQSGFPPTAQQAAGQQTLPGSFLSAVTTAPLVGPLPGTTTLNLTFALPLQVNGAPGSGFPPIASFIQSLSTHSVQPLTPATFAVAYGPPTGSDTAAAGFATANGLTVTRTYGSHSAVSVTGTAAAIESAFYVLLNQYQRSDGSIFYAPANVPSVNLTQPLLGVLGLDNFSRAIRTQIIFPGGPPPPPAPAAGVKGSSTALCPTVSPLGGSDFAGGDFISAYFGSGCTSGLNGQGQTIAVFSLDSYFADDITGYADGTATGSQPLAVPPGLTNVSQEVYPSSQSVPFGMQPFVPVDADQGSGVDTEVELDIDMVLSMAPQANIIVYETSNSSEASGLLAQIADDDTAQVVSSSWQWGVSTLAEQQYVWNSTVQMATQSQSYFAGAGDYGSLLASDPYSSGVAGTGSQPQEPIIDSEYITVVGGTELSSFGETTWNDANIARSVNGSNQGSATSGGFCNGTTPDPSGGGGALSALPLPTWQEGLNQYDNQEIANPSARMIPDVSMVADGIVIACGVNIGGCGLDPRSMLPKDTICTGGTSAAAPLWAGLTALINQANGVGGATSATPIGFLNPILYQLAKSTSTSSAYTTDFNDIADNSNNNWFDDGTRMETGTLPTVDPLSGAITGYPSVGKPYIADPSVMPLQGVAPLNMPETAGLYHAVTGYDLATGLGTPNCSLFLALAPSVPALVTINYHQVGECGAFPEDTNDLQVSTPDAFVVFAIDGIVNDSPSTFSFNPAQLFAPTNSFPFENCDTLESCLNGAGSGPAQTPDGGNCPEVCFPTPFATAVNVGAGQTVTFTGGAMGTQYLMVNLADPSAAPGAPEGTFFLSYSATPGVAPVQGGSLAPNVTFHRTMPSGGLPPDVSDCSTVTLD